MIGKLTQTYTMAAVCLVGLAAATPAQREAKDAALARTWKLAFVRNDDIWITNGDGSGQRLLIQKGERPCWSPDHKRIAFVRGSNIWVADANGQGQRQLTTFPAERDDFTADDDGDLYVDLTWDPRSDRIMFSHPESYQITKIGKAGKTIMRGSSLFDVALQPEAKHAPDLIYDLTDSGASYHFSNYNHPAWSRDGRLCVYTCNGDIRLCTRLSAEENPESDVKRNWQVDVTRLAAVAFVDAPTWRGSRQNHGAAHLSWAPNASFLVYAFPRQSGSGFQEIHLLQLKKGEGRLGDIHGDIEVKADRFLGEGTDPCVSPDGKLIVYDGYRDLHVVTTDGKEDRVLIKDGEQPAW
jgi:Tol biopolymer transport system component